jgi:peroxin-5
VIVFLSKSVLRTEAAVQHDPTNASAWFMLGVRQQENEREDMAIQALNRAVQLDPKHRAALLALAVSHTNENDRAAALDAIERWVDASADANELYQDAVRAHRTVNHPAEGGVLLDRQRDLVECLMTMARAASGGQIDADIQIALGVLLNASEVSSSV